MGVIHEKTEAQLDPGSRPEIDRETHRCRGRDRDMEIKRQTKSLEENGRRDGQAQRKMREKGQARHTEKTGRQGVQVVVVVVVFHCCCLACVFLFWFAFCQFGTSLRRGTSIENTLSSHWPVGYFLD